MSDNVTRLQARSLKEQFSRNSEAWKEQSDPIFRFYTEGDWWGLMRWKRHPLGDDWC
jgi:hypothetical protein